MPATVNSRKVCRIIAPGWITEHRPLFNGNVVSACEMPVLHGAYRVNSADPDASSAVISAYSRRQAMDWSLVLASQDISATIVQPDPASWGLIVEPQEYDRALQAIRLYRLENRRWAWRQPIPWSQATFHWGALGWSVILVCIDALSWNDLRAVRAHGTFNSAAVAQGEWWRAFTAILLHADLPHLLANATTGFLLLGLAMARYGAGLALCAAYLAGAAGNLAGLLLHSKPYIGLGASGMVMGALGLISIPQLGRWPGAPGAAKQVLRALLAGVLLFVLLGTNPASDVIAHSGGFVAGALLGLVLNALPQNYFQSRALAAFSWVSFGALVVMTSWLALHGSG